MDDEGQLAGLVFPDEGGRYPLLSRPQCAIVPDPSRRVAVARALSAPRMEFRGIAHARYACINQAITRITAGHIADYRQLVVIPQAADNNNNNKRHHRYPVVGERIGEPLRNRERRRVGGGFPSLENGAVD